MKFLLQNQDKSALDPSALSDELIKVFGTNYEISTSGAEIITHSVIEPDPMAFQAVIDSHIANAPKRYLDKTRIVEVKRVQAFHALALTPSGTVTLYDDVVSWVSMQPLVVQIDFNNMETFTLFHPAIQTFKTLKGWSDSQLQDLFILAKTL